MKKGFTLIELLAVIVILAIIMIITVPAINKLINDSRGNSFKVSLESLLKVAKNDYQSNARVGEVTYTLKDNNLTCTSGCNEGVIDIKYSGNVKNAEGYIKITDDNVEIDIENLTHKGKYEQKYDEDNGMIGKVVIEEKKENDSETNGSETEEKTDETTENEKTNE